MNKYTIFRSLLIAAVLLTFSSCKKDSNVEVETENYKGVVVVNEGAFGKSNGSVGIYKPGDKTYFDAFKKANDRPIGDVVQSLSMIGDHVFIAVNNSNKIEVLKKSDFKSVATISTVSPRYILELGGGRAYVSNLYSNSIKILNTGGMSLSGNIDINHNSDQMAVSGKKVFISTFDNKIMVVNTDKDSLSDSISTASGLSKVVNAGSGKLAVLCTGVIDWNTGAVIEKGKIHIIETDSNKVEKTFDLDNGSYGGSMVYSSLTGLLYFSLGNNIIYKMGMDGVISEFVTLEAGRSVYGLTFNSSTSELYVMDAGDFSSAGKVMVYSTTASKLFEFSAGIAPNGVYFNN